MYTEALGVRAGGKHTKVSKKISEERRNPNGEVWKMNSRA